MALTHTDTGAHPRQSGFPPRRSPAPPPDPLKANIQLFKTLKYGPEFPECFASVHDAGAFISGFVDWYNHHHQHSGIGFHTPANVHNGHAAGVARERSATLTAARAKHPERFTTSADPKILALPGPAWINQPKETTEQSAA